MDFLLTVVIFAICSINLYALYKLHKRIDSIFTIDKPAPNEASKIDPNLTDLDDVENVPQNVKLEVEGGDTQVPPGFVAK